MSRNTMFFTCYFGKIVKHIHQAPSKGNSYFFANNTQLKDVIDKAGWKFVLVNFEISEDYLVSSLQSKYVKFLKFLKDYPNFEKQYTVFVYIDGKYKYPSNFINDVLYQISNCKGKDLIIKEHNVLNRKSIWDEVRDASGQERYKRNMHKTVAYLNDMIKKGVFSHQVRVCATGFIIYINYKNVLSLIDDVYDICIEHEQPECQIYWAALSQKYTNQIHTVPFESILGIRYH